MGLEGKNILVTGASKGIGKSIALQLAQLGANLALHCHGTDEETLAVQQQLEGLGAKAIILKADFNNPKEAGQLGTDAWKQIGRIDILINNAGISYKKHFLDITENDVDAFINVNLKSTLLLTQSITKQMVLNKVEGSVLTITSVNGIRPAFNQNMYGATKGALETLMKGVALELAPHNIRVNTVALGAIQTEMNAGVWQDEEKLKALNGHIPLSRMGTTDEVAATIVGIVSNDSYMTGSTIVLDGGWLLKAGFVSPKPYEP